MQTILDIQKQLLPDLIEVMQKRYTILNHIQLSGRIGRRTLADALNLTERILRGEADFLKEQGLLEFESQGMKVTAAGVQLLDDLEPMMKHLFGITELEERIRQEFHVSQVVVVPGDSDHSPFAKKELGRAGAAVLRKMAAKDSVVAVTGGSTMAEVANHLNPSAQFKGCWFVPARGGLGESLEFQANSIASTMAKKTGCQYRLLHVPDHLGEDAYQSLIQDPNIAELIEVIRHARMVVHGIGEAIVMARRRKVDDAAIRNMLDDGALAESFGYYFDRKGVVIHQMPTVGLRLEDIMRTETVIAVAGGKSKGESIAAVMRFGHDDVLVTDEAAAKVMLRHPTS